MIITSTDDILTEVLPALKDMVKAKGHVIAAIDGRCASGKSTLAKALKNELSCSVVQMDHFFLQPHQRTSERLKRPGGNVDMERFSAEVLENLLTGVDFSYRPFDCQVQDFAKEVHIPQSEIYLIEGAYSCLFAEHFNYKIFMTVSNEEQINRLRQRNPTMLQRFLEEWIPLEEKYFEFFKVEELCNITYNTG